ncbi:MAG: UDP-N-acetylmuramoyl-tripeptide--D-alanyl-D-alanine ligase [Candidatus Eisenbacteria bacterium]|nr:UDP-N-acetylmuramoyl-tripeptide--D-alanyl-D-alanine ligase [Candidatus Eisenbacteria bacterium]
MKVSFTVNEIIKATGAAYPSEGARRRVPEFFPGISVDSRTVGEGELFVALRGNRFDGHDFIDEALSGGASAALVSSDWVRARRDGDVAGAFLVVRDSLAAFQELGKYHRIRINPRVVAVTGSNGKTTTKDLIAAVSSAKYPTAKTQGNLNNQFGVPITLLQLKTGDEVAVVEMGMNHPGELRRLAELCMPSIAVITNASASHLEGLGTVHDVARAKSELAEDLSRDDWLILHRDSEELYRQNRTRRCRIVTFGMSEESDLFPRDVRHSGRDGTELQVDGFPPVRLALLGRQNVLNALAALAASRSLGVPPEIAVSALATTRPAKGRMEIKMVGPATFVDDSYNANPISMKMALETLFSLDGFGRRMAVLGDMLELGDTSERWHVELGVQAGKADMLLLRGQFARAVERGALSAGMDPGKVSVLGTHAEMAERILAIWAEGDLFLLKGSRGMEMEKVLAELARRVKEPSGPAAAGLRREA